MPVNISLRRKELEVAKQNELEEEKKEKGLTGWKKVHNLRAWVSQLNGSRHRGFRQLDVFVIRRVDTVPTS
jgi:hypothetical protein